MKRMLINATHSEEVRVAIAAGQKLYNLDIDVPGQDRKKGNIYKGKITRVEPSLEAAFVDYGADRHGFLPYKEISRNYYTPEANKAKERPSIAQAIKEGTEVIIQVNKEERGNKGAAISTYISLAGRYLVYMPENPKAGGISRRIEGKTRQQLKSTLSQINMPKNAGVIVRTAGVGRSVEEIEWDLNYLDQVWTAIKTSAASRPAPFFIYQESDLFIRALRDYLRPDIGEILIDDRKMYEQAREFMQQVMPHNLKKLSYYNDTTPLFSRYQIESQIQSAFSREVQLPSGGSLVIDHTEAMISIDINSARATKGADIEETALHTNLEAADEIARQLRIRDLGGLVVIDFIDMRNHKNQRKVEQQLNEAVENDRARIQTSKISRFGLLEMSRQRLRSSINESSQFVCPRCSGHGFIRNVESLSVSILRIMEEEALKPDTGKVVAQVPNKVANFIMNEKRDELNNLEASHNVPMVIVANEFYQSPQFDIQRLKSHEAKKFNLSKVDLIKPEEEEKADNFTDKTPKKPVAGAAVNVITPIKQAPVRKESAGMFSWIKGLFSSDDSKKSKTNQSKANAANKKFSNNQNKKQHQGTKKPQHQNKQQKKVTKKPVHNHQKNAQKKPQQQKQTQNKPQQNKPQHNKQKPQQQQKQQQTKQGSKPNTQKGQVAKSQHPAQKPKNQPQKQQSNNHQKKQQPNKQGVQKIVVDKDLTALPKANEEMLKRPLGSVASYAAKKAQQNANKPEDKKSHIETQKVEPPKVEQPKAEKPKAEKPKVEPPKAEPPKAEPPKAEQPKAEQPKAEQPKAEKPKAEPPKAEPPKAEKPKAEKPKAEKSKAEPPKAEQPKAEKPKAEKPKAEKPKAEKPKAEKPKAEQPKVEKPKVEKPKVEKPKVEKPKVEKPKVEKPKATTAKVKKQPKPKIKNPADGLDFDVTDSVVEASKKVAKPTEKSKPKVEKKTATPKQAEIDFDI